MSKKKLRIAVYMTGVTLGCLILLIIPRPKKDTEQKPWIKNPPPINYYPLTYSDSYQRNVIIIKQPWRIVTLHQNILEVFYQFDEIDRIIATTITSKNNGTPNNFFKIGSSENPNINSIIELKPDLVIGTTITSIEFYQKLTKNNIPAISFDSNTTDTKYIRDTANILALPGKALTLIKLKN